MLDRGPTVGRDRLHRISLQWEALIVKSTKSSSSLVEDLNAIATDLALLADDLRWVHTNGHWPIGRGLDAPRGASLAEPADQDDPDRVRGPRHDVGTGDYSSRRAWRVAIGWLVLIEMRLAIALELGRPGPQPRVVRPSPATPLADVLQVVADCSWRARQLGEVRPSPMVRKLVGHARANVDSAVRDLGRALNRGPTAGIAHTERACKNCKVRPMAERQRADGTRKPARHGECDTCAKWRQRNGTPRPADKLDAGPLAEARSAKARRTARGEGWGEA